MLYAIVAVIILICDQALKYWVTRNILLDTGLIDFIPGFISLTRSHNYGAAFSILQNARVLFIVLAVVFIIIAISLLFLNAIRSGIGRWALVAVLAGAIGNGIDRVIQGYVVDMLRFEFINFPIFNIADIFITCGGITFCFYVIFNRDPWTTGPEPVDAKKFSARRSKIKKSDVSVPDSDNAAPGKIVDPENPFAEWQAPGSTGAEAGKPQQTPAPAAEPVRNTQNALPDRTLEFDDEVTENYSVEDILAEFRDKDV